MIKVLDSFAGAGGFSLGFALTGQYDIIGAIEIDKWASETFKANHPESAVLCGDIQKFSDEELRSFFKETPDVILGGPPCQGYSICNRNAGDPADPRNTLFSEFIRLGKIFSPALMIMENVPNIAKAKTKDHKLVLSIIQESLEELGYNVYMKILQASDYGVPQMRKRMFVIASKEQIAKPFPMKSHVIEGEENLFLSGMDQCPVLWDAISDLPDIEAGKGAATMQYIKQPENSYQSYLRDGSTTLFNHQAMKHSKRIVQRFEAMKCGDSVADVPDHLRPIKRNGNGEISDKLYDQNNRRMHPNKLCHTVPASFYANFVHPFKNRNFTPREGARIQSFPDWYVFKGKPTVVSGKLLEREGRIDEKFLCQYNQIGNAVPPLMAQAIALNIFIQLFK